jgi:hypothetical protein
MKDLIIAEIAAYLEAETYVVRREETRRVEFGGAINPGHFTHSGFCREIAAEIEKKISHIVYPKDFPYDKLFDHMAAEHGLTLTNTELGDIIHIARS